MSVLTTMRDRRLHGQATRAQMAAFGAGNLPVQLMSQVFAAFVIFFYVDRLGVPAGLVGIAMVVHGVFNAVLNPLIGHVSDRTRSRWGRRVPWIGLGFVPLCVVFALIWMPPDVGTGALFWYFVVMVLAYDVMYVLVILNYVSLFPEMFRDNAERARAMNWRQIFGIVGMIAGAGAAPFLYSSIGWASMGLVLGAICLSAWAYTLTGCVERDRSADNEASGTADGAPEAFGFGTAIRYTLANKAFLTYVLGSFLLQVTVAILTASVPFFIKYVLGIGDANASFMLGTIFVVAIPCVFLWTHLVARWGPRRTMLVLTVIYGLSLAPFLVVQNLAQTLAASAFVGVGVAGLLVMLDMMLAEVIDDDETRTGRRREGMYFGMNGFIVRFSVSLQGIVMAVVLGAYGYVEDAAAQPASVADGVRLMFGGIPLVVIALAWVCFWLYPLGRVGPGTASGAGVEAGPVAGATVASGEVVATGAAVAAGATPSDADGATASTPSGTAPSVQDAPPTP